MRILRLTFLAALSAACAGESSTPTSNGEEYPTTVPSAPTLLSGSAGDSRATIFFTTPTSTGGTTITTYTATCTAGTDTHSATRSASPIQVGGLTNGVTYSCSVTAKNAIGEGPASAAISITPGATAS